MVRWDGGWCGVWCGWMGVGDGSFESPQYECHVEPLAEWMYTWIQTV